RRASGSCDFTPASYRMNARVIANAASATITAPTTSIHGRKPSVDGVVCELPPIVDGGRVGARRGAGGEVPDDAPGDDGAGAGAGADARWICCCAAMGGPHPTKPAL